MQEKVVYLTAEGKHRFTAELHELVTVRRHEVEEQIRRAKEFSDTVDNAEYEEAKTDQAFVEGRILELERLLSSAKVIEEPTTRADFVRLGATSRWSTARAKKRPTTWSVRTRPTRADG